jgi:hypothetical protein
MDGYPRALSRAPRTEPPLWPCRPSRRRMEFAEPPPHVRICHTRVPSNSVGMSRGRSESSTERATVLEVDSETRSFVERALRLVLEVFDHRRPVAQLAAVADTSVVSAVRTLVRADLAPGRTVGTAVLTRVDVVMVDAAAAEVCAAYDRGQRHFALAGRIAHSRGKGWRLTALRIF